MYDRGAVYDSMPGFSGVGGAMDTVTSFVNHMLAKEPVTVPQDNSGAEREGTFDWSWNRFNTTGSTFATSIPISDIPPNTPGHLRVDLLSSYSPSTGDMTGELGSVPLPGMSFVGGGQGGAVVLNPVNPIRLAYTGTAAGVLPELVSFTIEWEQPLRLPASGKMTVYTGGVRGRAAYRLSGVDGAVYVVRIAPDESRMSLVHAGDPGAGGTVMWSDSTGIGVRYFVVKQSLIRSAPAGNNATVDQNTPSRLTYLRDPANTADYLVVYGAPFYNEALRLVNHKARMGRFSAVKMVCIDDVYREFSGGDVDPTALRNFLLYAKRGWTKGNELDYVVLMGNGNYDYKHISSTEQVFIPVFLQGDGAGEICMEDYFAFLDSTLEQVRGMRIGVSIGRFTCNTSEEARIMVDKIIDAEDPAVADFGSWRNRFLAVADDDMQLGKYDGIQHTASSDSVVSTIMNQWPSIDVRKLYLFDYPTNGSYEKPTAELALTNYFNNGFGFINWFGHGADVLWADERLLQVRDMGSLNNYKRYPVVTSFSCTVGRFDKPGHECLNDLLVKLPRAGAIIGIASSRLAYADANEEMGKVFYKVLFDTTVVSSTGNAYSATKLQKVDLRSYVFLGDPSIVMMNLKRRVSLKMTDETGKSIDTIKAMQNVIVEGLITGRKNDITDTRFGVDKSAYAYVSVFNTADTAEHVTIITKNEQVDTHYYTKYPLPGRPLFVGQTTVKDGRFSLSFLLPRNVTFDKPGIRLTAYAWQGSDVGTGFDGSKIFHGTKPLETTDTIGPRISVRPYYGAELSNRDAGATFTDRITSSLPLNIKIDLSDESGLDVTGIGPDEGLTLEIPGQMRRQNIGNQFQYEQGDFRRGSATLVFEEERMQPGTYQMKIAAQDYLGNKGSADITLEIVPKMELKLDRVFNYPNPMRMREGTKFYVYTSNINRGSDPLDADVSIRISTLSGKVLRVIRPRFNGEFWDGTDQRGNLLSPNIYLYQATARSEMSGAEQTVRSQVQKLVILPPH